MRLHGRINIACLFVFLFSSGHLFGQAEKLYLNPATAGAAIQSKFIEITKFYPVDATSQKISDQASLFITKKYWAVYDYTEKKIYFLDKNAKLVKTISLKKYDNALIKYDPKNDLLKFNIRNKNYTLLDKDLVKIRADYSNKKNRKYFKNYIIDLKEEVLEIKKVPTDPYFIIDAHWYYDDYYYLNNINIHSKDSIRYQLEILKNHQPLYGFFPYNIQTNKLLRSAYKDARIHFSDTDTPYIKYISKPFYPTIFRLDKDSMNMLYEIILPAENALAQSVLENGFKSKTDWESFRNRNNAVFYSLGNISNSINHLFFSIEYMRGYKSFLYDKKNGIFYNAAKIKADSTQYNLHLLQNGPGEIYEGKYYSLVSAQSLSDFYSNNKEKNVHYPPELEAWLKTASKNSNPVLVEYQLKN